MVAQGALNQIVGSVFNRVRPDPQLAASAATSMASPRMSLSRSNSRMGQPINGNGASVEHLPGVNGGARTSSEELPPKEEETQLAEEPRRSTDTVRPVQDEAEEQEPERVRADEVNKEEDGPEGTPRITVDPSADAQREDDGTTSSTTQPESEQIAMYVKSVCELHFLTDWSPSPSQAQLRAHGFDGK